MLTNLSSSNNSLVDSNYYDCYMILPNKFFFITFNVTQVVVLLPLCISILYSSLQQQLNHSTSLAGKTSHSDSFTYHMVIVELIGVFGCILSFIGNCLENIEILSAGLNIFWFTWYGQTAFHCLTCLERYLAVVHPTTYLSLRREKGKRIRKISICCVWLLSFGGVVCVTMKIYVYLDIFIMLLTTTFISFFSISILCVLIRPGPGEQGKEKTDQLKHKAFHVILVILGILMLRLTVDIVWVFLDLSGNSVECAWIIGSFWISLPSSLVLPLLYLQRTGKILCCKGIFECRTP